jgi:hypothetical protein
VNVQASPSHRRRVAARARRVALVAAAVVAGAIVLSGCVVIQSESAVQGNVIGNTITVTSTFCTSNAAAAAPCNSGGNSGKFPPSEATASNAGQLMVGYRIPAGVTAPPTIATTVTAPDQGGNPVPTPVTFTFDPNYTSGLGGLLGAPAGTQWVGYVSQVGSWTAAGQQSIALSPTFTLPAGFTGTFSWRTVVGYRAKIFSDMNAPVQCPAPFPGVSYVNPALTSQPSVCVDSPDAATINGPANPLAVADLAIAPPATPTVTQGGTATLTFSAAFSGGVAAAAPFAAAASTTVPGATAAITPAGFQPGPGAATPLTVSFAVPASAPAGTYDVGVSATVAGITRVATGHVTVITKAAAAAAAAATKKATATVSVKKTSLKVARKTGITLTITVSKASATSLVALQAKPKVSVTVKKTVKAGKKTTYVVKSKKFHKGKVTLTIKGGGLTKTATTTLS